MLNLKKKIIMKKFNFSEAEKIVIKLGSSIVTNDGDGLDEKCLSSLIKQISILSSQNKKVILVSSGAIAAGLRKLGIEKRPKILSELQSAAAVGQMDLVRIYEELFSDNNLIAAQVLLTHNDLSDRKRYLNARSTIFNLIKNNVIPVINENDTVASEEIRFGDNDTLAAMVANLIEADLLVLLTDQDGLFSSDPREDNDAKLIHHSYVDDKNLDSLASGTKSKIGTGGMTTKIMAARKAALSGAHTIIASGRRDNILVDLSNDKDIGTFLQSREVKLLARKKWLADNLKENGKIYIDNGAEIKEVLRKGRHKGSNAVDIARTVGNEELVDFLESYVADTKEMEAREERRKKRKEMGEQDRKDDEDLEQVISRKRDVNKPLSGSGSYALHLAVERDDSGLIRELLKLGAKINVEDKECISSYRLAIQEGNIESLECLLENGDVLDIDSQRESMLEMGIKKGGKYADIVMRFLSDSKHKSKRIMNVLKGLRALLERIEIESEIVSKAEILLKIIGDTKLELENGRTLLLTLFLDMNNSGRGVSLGVLRKVMEIRGVEEVFIKDDEGLSYLREIVLKREE